MAQDTEHSVTASSPFSLAGSVAAVVGTSPNIGTGIALQLAAAGARVACVDKDEEMAKHAAGEIHAAGGDAIAIACDVTSESDVIRALAAIRAEFGLVDVLVNGPVIYLEKGIRQMSLGEWRQQLSVLLDGTFLFTKFVAESLIAAGRPGAVINLVSTAGHQGEPGNIGYTTAKGGIVNMTRAAAMDLAPYGIRVNNVAPDFVPTPALESVISDEIAYSTPTGLQIGIPMGRPGKVTDVSNCVVFLASNLSSYITGTTLHPDGGTHASAGWFNWPGAGWQNHAPIDVVRYLDSQA